MVDHEETPTGERQVFCDRSIFSRNKDAMHVTLLKNPQGGEPDWDIWSCPLGKDGEGHDFKHYHHPQMDFPAGLWEALKVRGWKPRKARRHALLYSDPYLRGFPEETLHLYGRKFLSDPFLPMVEAVLTLERNMYAANRMMAPTPTGYQCGHYPAQMKVAELTLKLAKAKIAERKRYR
jgi:hypothetical protein